MCYHENGAIMKYFASGSITCVQMVFWSFYLLGKNKLSCQMACMIGLYPCQIALEEVLIIVRAHYF